MSIRDTLYIQVYSIRGVYPKQAIKSSRTLGSTFGNTDGNGFRYPD